MKKNKLIWNYIDMLITIIVFLLIIVTFYLVAEALERYIYRYTIFPFVASIMLFTLGVFMGRAIERTRKGKPIGFVSKKMNKFRKRQNMFIFSDDGETYVPHKEIIEDIKSGEIVHIKHFENSNVEIDDFDEVYKVDISDLVDDKMDEKENEDN